MMMSSIADDSRQPLSDANVSVILKLFSSLAYQVPGTTAVSCHVEFPTAINLPWLPRFLPIYLTTHVPRCEPYHLQCSTPPRTDHQLERVQSP